MSTVILPKNIVDNQALQAALDYLRQGWSVIPIHSIKNGSCTCGQEDCEKPGKHSIIKWKEYQSRHSTEAEVRQWFLKWPWANVGIVTGAISGLLVLDIDGPEGAEALAGLGLPSTFISETGGGGWHYYFRYPEGSSINNRISLLPHVDIRAEGGYAVAPPSNHISGREYTWFAGADIGGIELADPPQRLLDLLKPHDPVRVERASGFIPKGNLLPCADVFIEKGTGKGTRDICLFTLAKHCRKAGIDKPQALDILKQANGACVPPLPIIELKNKVDSAYSGQAGQGYSSCGCDETAWEAFCPGKETCPMFSPAKHSKSIREVERWPEELSEDALYGLAGEVIRAISPYSEADDTALIMNFLVAFGNVIGSKPYFSAGPDKHKTNLFAVLAGESSKGRKGQSWGWIREIYMIVDENWALYKTPGGLSTGEGLIWQVRDQIVERQPIKEKGRVVDYEEVVRDAGIEDKRLLVVEAEFSTALKVMERSGNTLSDVVRKAWDCGILSSMTKNSPARATGAHISIIGHITRQELLKYMTSNEAANGFGNRFLWCCVRRSKYLPDGERIPQAELNRLAGKIIQAVVFARDVEEMVRDEAAQELWRAVYPQLSEGKPGLLGAVTGRAEAQVVRLSCIYALLDLSRVVRCEHLMAALAIWERCEDSARFIFGDKTGNQVADDILEALSNGPMTQTQINDYFGGHISTSALGEALKTLQAQGKITEMEEKTAGRPKRLWKRIN